MKDIHKMKELMVLGLLAAFLLPVAITQLAGVNTSTWDAQTILVFGLFPIAIVIVGVLIAFDKL